MAMQMKIGCTSVGLKIPFVSKDHSLGLSGANGVVLQIKQGYIIRIFVMSLPVSISTDGSLGVVGFETDWFMVNDPNKGVMIKDFDKKLAEVDIKPLYGRPRVDVSLKIYDKHDQPWYYTMEKADVLMKGLITSKFHLREKMKLSQTKGYYDEVSDLAMR